MAILKQVDTEKLTRDQAAAFFAVSVSAFDKWVKDKGCPVCEDPNKRGKSGRFYKLEDMLAWYVSFRSGKDAAELGPLDQQRLRKLKADADRAELRFSREKLELIPADEVEKAWKAILLATKHRLGNLSERQAGLLYDGLGHEEKKAVLEAELRTALDALTTPEFVAESLEDEEVEL